MERKLLENKSIIVDSGAHTLYTQKSINISYGKNYDFYKSKDFWDYVDKYAKFLVENKKVIDFYVNVDVIFNPELSWKVQKYLEEKYKLTPMPVIHYGTSIEWLEKYMKNYEYIGIGGLGQMVRREEYTIWADSIFNFICNNSNRIPKIKTHGFAMTSIPLMIRYPWYSVDSTTWLKFAGFGNIPIPQRKNNQWIYDKSPLIINFSISSPIENLHFNALYPKQQENVLKYIKEQGFILGNSEIKNVDKNYKLKENERWVNAKKNQIEIIKEQGIINCYRQRRNFCIKYFLQLQDRISTYPRTFKIKRKGFSQL